MLVPYAYNSILLSGSKYSSCHCSVSPVSVAGYLTPRSNYPRILGLGVQIILKK